jgi:hypothetical protein
MEGVICWPTERTNFSARPGYADFGGHFMPRVTFCSIRNIYRSFCAVIFFAPVFSFFPIVQTPPDTAATTFNKPVQME